MYDMNIIYSRIIGLQARGHDIYIKAVPFYELAPVPTSMFDQTGEMRAFTSKSFFKLQVQVEVSAQTAVRNEWFTSTLGNSLACRGHHNRLHKQLERRHCQETESWRLSPLTVITVLRVLPKVLGPLDLAESTSYS